VPIYAVSLPRRAKSSGTTSDVRVHVVETNREGLIVGTTSPEWLYLYIRELIDITLEEGWFIRKLDENP
jgi:hypothetical protein